MECQLEVLRKCRTHDSLIKSLGSLPKTLDETYERVLTGIDDSDRELAIVAFQWLAFSARPLRLDELAEALAVRPGSTQMDNLFTPQDILTICSSLVTLTSTGELKLAHFTVKEYLLSDRILLTSVAAYATQKIQASKCIVERSVAYLCHLGHRECEDDIASTYIALLESPHSLKELNADENLCARYSSRSSAPKPRMRSYRTGTISTELKKIAMDQEYRLLGYAATYWHSHLEKMSTEDLVDVMPGIANFFLSATAFMNWTLACHNATRGKGIGPETQSLWNKLTPVDLGIITTVMNIVSFSIALTSIDLLWVDDLWAELDNVLSQSLPKDRYSLAWNLSKLYGMEEVEASLACFIFKDLGSASPNGLQQVFKNNRNEDLSSSWTNFAATGKKLRDQSRLQLKILIFISCENKCFNILDTLVSQYPAVIEEEFESLPQFTTSFCSEDVAERLLQKNPALRSQLGSSLVALIFADRPKLLRLVMGDDDNLTAINYWDQYDDAVRSTIRQENFASLNILLSKEKIIAHSKFVASIPNYLKMAISQRFIPNIESLLTFKSLYTYDDISEAISFAVAKTDYGVVEVLVRASCDSSVAQSPQNDDGMNW